MWNSRIHLTFVSNNVSHFSKGKQNRKHLSPSLNKAENCKVREMHDKGEKQRDDKMKAVTAVQATSHLMESCVVLICGMSECIKFVQNLPFSSSTSDINKRKTIATIKCIWKCAVLVSEYGVRSKRLHKIVNSSIHVRSWSNYPERSNRVYFSTLPECGKVDFNKEDK